MSPIDDSDKMQRSEVMKAALRSVLKESNHEIKDLLKEALKEWLDERFANAGKFGLSWILIASIGLLGYALLWKYGWQPPQK